MFKTWRGGGVLVEILVERQGVESWWRFWWRGRGWSPGSGKAGGGVLVVVRQGVESW